MDLSRAIETAFRRFLPSPFTIAVLLTLLTMFLASWYMDGESTAAEWKAILSYWEAGLWNTGLLVFAFQIMLILVLGHVLVLSRPMERIILKITGMVRDSSSAALLVILPTLIVSFFNWGLGLIFGALLARKVGEYARQQGIAINYPLIGACGYSGLMVWHGGISGSAPLKVAEDGHLKELMETGGDAAVIAAMPDSISTALTVLSPANLITNAILFTFLSLLAYYLGKRAMPTEIKLQPYHFRKGETAIAKGADKLDVSPVLSVIFGLLILLAFGLQYSQMLISLNITPNMLNFFMLGLALLLHGNFKNFLAAVEEAIGDISGILIQFPLYFGIMGIMAGSGMVSGISHMFASLASAYSLPVFAFFSAGLVNIFVPSGGGQWAVQGPMLLSSAVELGVPLPKVILSLAYGDQITNMLQPFWALPLLGITKLKAGEILPYTLLFMLVGIVVFIAGLLLF